MSSLINLENLSQQLAEVLEELSAQAKLNSRDILVIGCSTSEICGKAIGTNRTPAVANALVEQILKYAKKHSIYVAAQCCEHLGRALVIPEEAMRHYRLEQVNVIPVPEAGGSFASAYYHALAQPVVVAAVAADAGLDIGQTLIGMHLKRVVVPVRLNHKVIGDAILTACRVRPPFVGGNRAVYNDDLL